MPFYVEYTINQNADIRSAVDGDNREEALARAADTVREAGCRPPWRGTLMALSAAVVHGGCGVCT